ncbi:MAG: SpoIID/LytB domain-containing protein [Bacilli bacterium]|nr:SpoIID/LytB domain-containing protein [Bacilli bacterium]
MFYKYMTVDNQGKKILYLYLNSTEEFSQDFSYQEKPSLPLYRRVYQYIKNQNIPFDGDQVCIVVNGIIIDSFSLSDYDGPNDSLVEVLSVDHGVSQKLIDLNHSTGIVERLKVDEYIFGIISNEMPSIFSEESLKAQAVVARTYAVKRLSRNLPIRDYSKAYIYRDKNYLKEIWGSKYDSYTKKIREAIRQTKDEVIKFDGDYIDAYYHLSSHGKTEDSSNVLKLAYPYLKSVSSTFDIDSNNVGYRIVPNEYLSQLLNVEITEDTEIQLLMKTIGHRVKYIRFGDKVFDGLLLARRLGLDSNDFSVSIGKRATTFTTRGHGHGLGLSKYGAEGMAKAGYNYRQILNHYYPNTYIEKEENFGKNISA